MIPHLVAWETTRQCPLACRHCRAAAGTVRAEHELTTAEGLRLIDSLAALPVRLLILTGGEPMMRPDIYDLARAAASRGMRVVMAPCGALLTDTTAARLKESGISAISISIDASNAADHDAFRGVNGAFDTALRGLRCARHAGLAIQINTTVSRLNIAQLPAMLDLAEREGAATLDCFFLVPTGRGKQLKDLQLDAGQVEQTLQWIADQDGQHAVKLKTTCAPQMARVRAQRGARQAHGAPTGGCMAGRGFLFVSHTGIVQPCGFLDLPCGDVRTFDFDMKSLLEASDDLRRLGSLEGVGGKCGYCEFLQVCGGCRARANAMSGDAMGEEPFCVGPHPTRPPASLRSVVVALQQGIPLEPRPFDSMARTLGLREADILSTANRMLEDGSARRFGAIFDARRLGYRSELCALEVQPEALDRIGALVAAHPGVTHAYLRGDPPGQPPFPALPDAGPAPNLWFTLAVLHNRFDIEMAALQQTVTPLVIRRFPAIRRFKIDVIFDAGQRDAAEDLPGTLTDTDPPLDRVEPLTESDRTVVRSLQGNLPVQSQFFAQVAGDLGLSEPALLARLQAWQRSGTLRRMALVVRHRRIGFIANAMCLWHVDEPAVVEAGRRLAFWPAVTHCYARVTDAHWPYNLYAMIHTSDWTSTRRLFERISESAGLSQGRMLGSLREFKKTSMQYFGETGSPTDA